MEENKSYCMLCNYILAMKDRLSGDDTDRFEKAFGDFIDSDVYDENENDPFALSRAAFKFAWNEAKRF